MSATEKLGPAKSTMVAFRIEPHKLEEIDRRASKHHLTRTDYLVRCALDELPSSRSELQDWREEITTRVARLERMVDLGAIE